MGKRTTTANEAASRVVSGSFSATGQSGNAVAGFGMGKSGGEGSHAPGGSTNPNATGIPPEFFQEFNALLYWDSSFTGSVQLERSFDGGTTWQIVSTDLLGTPAIYISAAAAFALNIIGFEPEYGVIYRWNCTVRSAGTANYRISQ